MYMYLPILTLFIGLLFVLLEKRNIGIFFLAVSLAILMYWFKFHASSQLNLSF